MHYLKDPIVVALLMLASLGALRWCGRTIVEAIANSKRVKVQPCSCGRLVYFDPPLKLPTKAEIYGFAGTVAAAMAAAEGIPVQGQIILEDVPPPADLVAAVEACSTASPCELCQLGGRVRCVRCRRDLGCHTTPTPLECEACRASSAAPPPDAELVATSPPDLHSSP